MTQNDKILIPPVLDYIEKQLIKHNYLTTREIFHNRTGFVFINLARIGSKAPLNCNMTGVCYISFQKMDDGFIVVSSCYNHSDTNICLDDPQMLDKLTSTVLSAIKKTSQTVRLEKPTVVIRWA